MTEHSPKPVKASVVVRIYGDTFSDVDEPSMVDEIRHRLDLPVQLPDHWEGTEFKPTEVEVADGDEMVAERLSEEHIPHEGAGGGIECSCGWPVAQWF